MMRNRRAPWRRHPAKRPQQGWQGFLLIETVIAILIMIIASIETTFLFAGSSQNSARLRLYDRRQNAINDDMTRVLAINDFTCQSAGCGPLVPGMDVLAQPPPHQFDYPINPLTDAENFAQRCDPNLTTPSIRDDKGMNGNDGIFDQIRNPPPGADPLRPGNQDLGFNRNIHVAITADPDDKHRYTVTWTMPASASSIPIQRQITLTPTAVAWCP